MREIFTMGAIMCVGPRLFTTPLSLPLPDQNNSLSTVLTSRMMLNLRSSALLQAAHRQDDSVLTRTSLEDSDQIFEALDDGPRVSTQAVFTLHHLASGAIP